MQIVNIDDNLIIEDMTAVAIGKFDGIHLGHQKLFGRLLEEKKNGLKTVVFTFDKSIAAFFSGKESPSILTEEEKQELLSEMGIDVLAVYPVNSESVKISPKDFIKKVLVDKLNAKVVVAGPDLSYADKGRGDFVLLESLSSVYGYNAVKIDKEIYKESGKEISSTYVREAISAGDMSLASNLLGRPYFVSGQVMHGRKLGRVMSFPTVNLIMDKEKLLPPYGVYLANVYVGSEKYAGVANVGIKPTISDNEKPCVETHIFDFDEELYGEYIRVEMLEFMRPEKKFNSIDELKNQLKVDIKNAKSKISTCL